MALKSRAQLKAYFETNDVPTSSQYGELIDSIPNFVDDSPSVGFKFLGAYSASANYIKFDTVVYNGECYVCILYCTNVLPSVTTNWTKIASKGTDGKEIVSVSFVGNDMVFVNNDASTFTLSNAKLDLTGPAGANGAAGATGATGATGPQGPAGGIAPVVTTLGNPGLDTNVPSEKLMRTELNAKQNTLTNPITGTGTTNEISYWASASTQGTLPVATYPSLTELSYVKGLTSSAQTQLNGKQATMTKAIGSEIDTGTDDSKFTTAKSIADSKLSYTDGTETLTNKRINPRLVTAASYTTDTGTSLSVATCDQFEVTAQAGALKLNNPGGTPLGGQKLIVRIKDNGTARALTYDTQFRAIGVTLPTTTIISKTLYLGFIYNVTDTKWDCVAVVQEA